MSVTTVTGKLTGANIIPSNARIWTNPEVLAASGAMSPYRPSVLKPSVGSFAEISTSPGVGQVTCCTTDSSKNIYIGGYYGGSGAAVTIKTFAANPNISTAYSLPNQNAVGYGWGFVLKYDSSGNYVYGAVFPSTSENTSYCYVIRLACDSSGNLYVALSYRSSGVTLYNMALNPAGTSSGYSLPTTSDTNPALIKYNSSGVYQYSTVVNQGPAGSDHGVACDSSGNVYWTTQIPSNASQAIYNLSASPNTSSSGYSIANQGAYLNLLIKYNSSGTYQSSTYVAVSAGAYDVILDSVGNIYWSFNYSGQSTMYNLTANPNTSSSGYSLINANGGYAWVALIKYNSSGTYQYSTVLNLSTSYSGGGWFCARDSSDNIYWAGPIYTPSSTTTVYNMTLNPNTSSSGYSFPSSNLGRGVIIKYNSSGTYQYSTSLSSSPSATYIYGVACDSSGTVYVVGQYATTATIYNMTLNPNTSSSGYSLPTTPSTYYGPFLASWNSSGTYLNSTSVAGADGYGVGRAVCCDSANSVYFAGWEQSTSTIYLPSANPNTISSGYNLANGGGFAIKYYNTAPTSLSMTLANLGAGVTTVVEKPIYNLSGAAVTVTENSNTWTIPATSNVATAMWTIDRWLIISYTPPVPPVPVVLSLYTFTNATFTPGGATGQNGPIISQARSGLTGTPAPSNWYNTYLNMNTQGIQLWTVPESGSYTIRVMGGSGGGAGGGSYGGTGTYGGRGVILEGRFNLSQNQIIKILVGQGGTSGTTTTGCDPAGGGGTFVVDNSNNPIIIAGGGGGAATAVFRGVINGQDGLTTTTGGTGALNGGAGGSNGAAGNQSYAQAGAGFNGNGPLPNWSGGSGFTIAYSFVNGGIGATSTNQTPNRNGGFGGGGGAHGNCCIGGGSGGGYSGGGGGGDYCINGAGGGSYIASTAAAGTVKTSDGLYNGSSTFNGYSITNLGTYNNYGQAGGESFASSGSVIITKL